MIFLRVLPKIFLWPHYLGAPGARGPPVHWTAWTSGSYATEYKHTHIIDKQTSVTQPQRGN